MSFLKATEIKELESKIIPCSQHIKSSVQIYSNTILWKIYCPICMKDTGLCKTLKKALKKWNRIARKL